MKQIKLKKRYKLTALVIVIIVALIMFLNQSYSSAEYRDGDVKMKRIEMSDQYKEKKFINSDPWIGMSFKENIGVMWDFMVGGDQRSPKVPLPVKQVDLQYFNLSGKNQLNSTWLGHSSLMINIDGYKVITDPVFEKKVSIAGPTRFNGNVPIDTSLIQDVDVVIISHNHYDHLNKMSIQLVENKTKQFIVPLGVGAQLEKWGVDRSKISEVDWWEEIQINEGFMIAATPAQHFSGRGLADKNKTLWVSYVLKGPEHSAYYSGDSGYFNGFKQIGETYGPFDMTFLECGAYDEKWHHIHMYPEETVLAHIDLKGDLLQPVHWATFNLALHSWFEPVQRLIDAAKKEKINITTPVVGETIHYNRTVTESDWWNELIVKK